MKDLGNLVQSILDYIGDLDSLSDKAEEDAVNELLQAINIDELLQDPEGYLLALSDAFLNRHISNIEKATEAGTKHASKILKAL